MKKVFKLVTVVFAFVLLGAAVLKAQESFNLNGLGVGDIRAKAGNAPAPTTGESVSPAQSRYRVYRSDFETQDEFFLNALSSARLIADQAINRIREDNDVIPSRYDKTRDIAATLAGIKAVLSQIPHGVGLVFQGNAGSCSSGGADRSLDGYVWPGVRSIFLCAPVLAETTEQLGQTLIHEAAHVAGIHDECAATEMELFAMIKSGRQPWTNSYLLSSCPGLMRYISDEYNFSAMAANKKVIAASMEGREAILSPGLLAYLKNNADGIFPAKGSEFYGQRLTCDAVVNGNLSAISADRSGAAFRISQVSRKQEPASEWTFIRLSPVVPSEGVSIDIECGSSMRLELFQEDLERIFDSGIHLL